MVNLSVYNIYPISANERIREVVATFELENMPLSEQDVRDLRDFELTKTTTEKIRQRILKEIKEENKEQ